MLRFAKLKRVFWAVFSIMFILGSLGFTCPTYADAFECEIRMFLDDPQMLVDGNPKEVDPGRGTTPSSINGRTMVPIRAVVEAMLGSIGWDEETKEISIIANGHTVLMWLDKTDLVVDGQEKTMDVAPISVNGRTLVPVRFAAENIGCKVEWLPETSEIVIFYSEVASETTLQQTPSVIEPTAPAVEVELPPLSLQYQSKMKTFASAYRVISIHEDGSVYLDDQKVEGIMNTAVEVAACGGDMGEEYYYVLYNDGTVVQLSGNGDVEKKWEGAQAIAGDFFSTLFITPNNELWSFYGELLQDVCEVSGRGDLALKTDGSVWEVQESHKVMEGVVQIDSYRGSFYALNNRGELFVWGQCDTDINGAGVPESRTYTLDTGEQVTNFYYYTISEPQRIAQNITSFSSGAYGVLTQKVNGEIWRGFGIESSKLDIGEDVVAFSTAVGWNANMYHMVFLKSDGSLWTNGNSYMNSGLTKITEGVRIP